jgi:hypothetical protein
MIEVPQAVRDAWTAIDTAFLPHDPVMLSHKTTVRDWLHGQSASGLDRDRMPLVKASVPVVYAWTTGAVFGDENWVAVCEDGELMASHVSSSREWGQRDVHLGFGAVAERYRAKFGGLGLIYYLFVVVPAGKRPPIEVLMANAEWVKRVEAGEAQRFDAPSQLG